MSEADGDWEETLTRWLINERAALSVGQSSIIARVAFVLNLRYCVAHRHTQSAIGALIAARIGHPLSGTRIAQIEARGLRFLRHPDRARRMIADDAVPPVLLHAVFGEALDVAEARARYAARLTEP